MADRATSLDGGGNARGSSQRQRRDSLMNRFSLSARPHSRQDGPERQDPSGTERKRMSLLDRAFLFTRPLLFHKAEQPKTSVDAMLQPGQCGFVYYPGDQMDGAVLISHPRADLRLHSIQVRVQGVVKIPRMLYDDISGQDRVDTLNWTFYDTDQAEKSSSYVVTIGEEPEDTMRHAGDRQVPFSFQLPTFCHYRSYDGFLGKRLVQLPPSMLIRVTMDGQHTRSRSRSKRQGKGANRSSSLAPLVQTASVQYFVTVRTIWQNRFGIRTQTIKCRLPFIVHRRPVSSSLIGHNTGSGAADRAQLDGFRAPPGMPSWAHGQETSGSVTAASFARQALADVKRAVRRDLVLLETPRGPEAWHVFDTCVPLERHGEEVRLEFSFLGTATIGVDKPVPFTIKVHHAEYTIDADSVRLDLLRSSTLHSSFGDVLLRSESPVQGADGGSIVDIGDAHEWDDSRCQKAPTDEYTSQTPTHTDAKASQSVRGMLTIKGGWDSLTETLETVSCTSGAKVRGTAKEGWKTHAIFLGDEEVICSSFTFGNFQLQHALRLTLSLISNGATEGATDPLPLQLDASIQLEVAHRSRSALPGQRFSISHDGTSQDRTTSVYEALRRSVSQRRAEHAPSRRAASSSSEIRSVLRPDMPSTEADSEHTPAASSASPNESHRNQSTSSITPLVPRVEADTQGWDDEDQPRPAALAHAMSIVSLRTIDGPSPSYFESLQARLSSP